MDKCIRILHLDDNPLDAELIRITLDATMEHQCVTLKYVKSKQEFLAELQCGTLDVILSDYRMPGFDGDDALKAAQEICPEVPFIMVTGELGEERAIETLQRGATDYVLKSNMLRLAPAIRRALHEAETERKRRDTERALREGEQRLRATFDNAAIGILETDSQYKLTAVNDHLCEMLGYSKEELIGKVIQEITAPEDLPQTTEYNSRLVKGEIERFVYEKRYVKHDRTRIWVHVTVSAIRDANGNVVRGIGTVEDISERVRAAEALRASEEQFRLIADTMPVLVWTARPDGTIDYGNRHSREYSGLPHIRFDEPAMESPIHPDDEKSTHDAWQAALRSGEPYEAEQRLRRSDGTYRWHLSRALPVRDQTGRIVRWYGTATDIHEIREAHQALEERVRERTRQLAEVNKELEEFASTVAHDLKAPLRIIDAFARMLEETMAQGFTEKQRDYVRHIKSSAAQMGELISSVLMFSKVSGQVPKVEPVDMRKMFEMTIEDQRRAMGESGRRVAVQIGDIPPAVGDPILLQQVLANLVSNALKFSRNAAEPRVEIGSYRKGNEQVYFVRDNGAGFPPSSSEKLFRIFQRLHRQDEFEGTGIGLANVRKIVERHGGRVSAEGEEGKGATFYFTLPQS